VLTRITTLIPAYKTKYLAELLTGLATQTHKPERVIISDDSPNGDFAALVRAAPLARMLPIEIHEGPRRGAYENFKHLIKLWDGRSELFHILLDDDVLYPDFYTRHIMAQAMGEMSCSISARWTANERGQPIEGMPIPKAVWFSNDRVVLLESSALFMSTLPECQNWLGEFSNCVMRASCAELLFQPRFEDVSYAGLWDLGAFLAASLIAPVAYIQDRLGYFRAGGEGHSAQMMGPHMKAAHIGYAALALGGERIGRLAPEQARRCYEGIAGAVAQRYAQQEDMVGFIAPLQALAAGQREAEPVFLAAWNEFLARHGF
jgi:hypothetical protein